MADGGSNGLKRKRNEEEVGTGFVMPPSAPHTPVPTAGIMNSINYLSNDGKSKLPLISGDPEGFQGVLNQIDEYQGVLRRHESLASNMGAKLVGSLLVKSVDKLFEGPIKILVTKDPVASISWLDLIKAARQTPKAFVLKSEDQTGARFCHVWIRETQVEISEDDYRLILSGAPERIIPSQPLPEDELAELGTIDILEHRLLMIIKKADSVAAEARILKRNLQSRRAAIQQGPFQAANTSVQDPQALHQELMRQFSTSDHSMPRILDSRATPTHRAARQSSEISSGPRSSISHSHEHKIKFPPPDDGSGGPLRPFMTAKVEKLIRGYAIYPPCDRCRRLRIDCTKHLTACTGCTKKHAKCAWKDVSVDEEAEAKALGSEDGDFAKTPKSGLMFENTDVGTSANLNQNLDPGLRGAGVMGIVEGEESELFAVDQQAVMQRDEGGMIAEQHKILSRMASAAADANVS